MQRTLHQTMQWFGSNSPIRRLRRQGYARWVAQLFTDTDLTAGLNEPQKAAVVHRGGPLLILAGAGSGKTRVLTHRIAPSRADAAMRGRNRSSRSRSRTRPRPRCAIAPIELIGGRADAMWLTTFHSACARILRSEAERLGYTSGYTIYDSSDSQRLVRQCLDAREVDTKRFPPRMIQSIISRSKNQPRERRAVRAARRRRGRRGRRRGLQGLRASACAT